MTCHFSAAPNRHEASSKSFTTSHPTVYILSVSFIHTVRNGTDCKFHCHKIRSSIIQISPQKLLLNMCKINLQVLNSNVTHYIRKQYWLLTMVSLWAELIQLQCNKGIFKKIYYHYLWWLESVSTHHYVFSTLKIPAAGYSDMLTST